ncbi:replication protein A 32 kDa subunit B-like isoform X3 [Phoenix dactylifera]|uniref:Replication protein A 32 kDa subunit B-like isoform X3 n=1 Tax=Phoenix dactylifera TaxID=42345 RepID=A0A8B9AIG4_PHODC|nr:replication protein A 32 kDa subunit B-like isoform X3 [Phoenix dactylifera]
MISIVWDGHEVRLLGLILNKAESVADISFTLDDGTGRIDINRWVNEFSDANEVAAIQNGMYVRVDAHMKGFQGKRHAFSVRPVTDFNDIVLHFIECIYVHFETELKVLACREVQKGVPAWMQTNPITSTPFSNRVKGYHAPLTNQSSAFSSTDRSGNDAYNLVLGVFQEPAILIQESLTKFFNCTNFCHDLLLSSLEDLNCYLRMSSTDFSIGSISNVESLCIADISCVVVMVLLSICLEALIDCILILYMDTPDGQYRHHN